tara:strand:+ start:3627 stop:5324 length:1698 start_codon:yes stop_codon:yes gene_type:complete
MQIIKVLIKILTKKEKLSAFFILVLAILNSFGELIGIGTLIPFFLTIIDPNNPILDYLYKFFKVDNKQLVIICCVLIFVVYSIKFLLQTFYTYCSANFSAHVNTRLSYNLYNNYLNDEYEEIAIKNDKGNIFRNIGLVGEVTNNIFNLINFIQALTITLILFISMLIVDFTKSIFLFTSLGSIVLIYYFFIRKRITNYGSKFYDINRESILRIFSAFDSIKSTKIVGSQEFFLNQFHETQINLNFINRNKTFLQSFPRLIMEYILVIGIIAASGYIIYIDDSNNIGAVLFISLSLVRILPNLFNMLTLTINYQYLKISFLSVFDKKFYESAKKNVIPIKTDRPSFNGHIKLNNISYMYPNSKNLVLDKLDLLINQGDIIGIKGSSGSGKTTLIDILLGFLKPQEGSILVNDNQVERLYKKFSKISYVVQEIFIPQTSIRENVAFGQNNIDDKRVIESLKIANFYDKFSGPEINSNLNYKLIQSGMNLSVGERQRLNIARAFYQQPKLLVLDELTSSLDEKNSKIVLDSVKNYSFSNKCTVLLISHKPSDYSICDRVFNLEKNKFE